MHILPKAPLNLGVMENVICSEVLKIKGLIAVPLGSP